MQAAETGTDEGGALPFGAVDVHYPASGGAQAALNAFVNHGLFRGQTPLNNPELVRVLLQLAEQADNARRQL